MFDRGSEPCAFLGRRVLTILSRLQTGSLRAYLPPHYGFVIRPLAPSLETPSTQVRSVKKAVLFDLDDTLVPEFANYGSAFAAACEELARNEDVDVERLRAAVFDAGLDAWRASPVIAYCRQARLGFAQGLLSDFPGDAPEIDYLRGWAPAYRRAAWTRGLAAVGLESEPFADQLAEAFRARLAAPCPP